LERIDAVVCPRTDRAGRPSAGTAQRATSFGNEQPEEDGAGRLGRRRIRAGRYGAAILLHCASAVCLSEAIGIFAAAVRQVCLALLSAALTFALLVVI
jgi:hypothetical protein